MGGEKRRTEHPTLRRYEREQRLPSSALDQLSLLAHLFSGKVALLVPLPRVLSLQLVHLPARAGIEPGVSLVQEVVDETVTAVAVFGFEAYERFTMKDDG